MGVAFGDVDIVNVGIGDHRFVNRVQIDHHFGGVFGVIVRLQRGLRAGSNAGDPRIGFVDEPPQHAGADLHALVDHHLDTTLGDLKRLSERGALRNTDGGFRLHLGCPIGEGEGLVGQQRPDMHLDDAALKNIFAVKLREHLGLRRVDDIAEVHMVAHLALEGHLDGIRNR